MLQKWNSDWAITMIWLQRTIDQTLQFTGSYDRTTAVQKSCGIKNIFGKRHKLGPSLSLSLPFLKSTPIMLQTAHDSCERTTAVGTKVNHREQGQEIKQMGTTQDYTNRQQEYTNRCQSGITRDTGRYTHTRVQNY